MQMNVMEQRWIGSSSRCLTPIECAWNAGMCIRTNCIDQVENRILQKLGPNCKALALWVWPEEITLILYEEEVASSLLPPWKTPLIFMPSLMISWPYLRYWGWAQGTLGPHFSPHLSITWKNVDQQTLCDIDGQCDLDGSGRSASEVQGQS